MFKKWIIFLLLIIPCWVFAATFHWVDLTHDFGPDTIYWPTEKSFKLETVHDGMTLKNYYYAAKQFEAAEHGGTHMDAPSHFAKDKKSVAEIPISSLMGKAVIIDVRKQALPDDDYLITIGDIKNGRQIMAKFLNVVSCFFIQGIVNTGQNNLGIWAQH